LNRTKTHSESNTSFLKKTEPKPNQNKKKSIPYIPTHYHNSFDILRSLLVYIRPEEIVT